MFLYIPENGTYWFNSNSLENESQFMLIGMLLALAIYNGLILNIHFAPVVYKKLLKKPIEFSDLKMSHPVNCLLLLFQFAKWTQILFSPILLFF